VHYHLDEKQAVEGIMSLQEQCISEQ